MTGLRSPLRRRVGPYGVSAMLLLVAVLVAGCASSERSSQPSKSAQSTSKTTEAKAPAVPPKSPPATATAPTAPKANAAPALKQAADYLAAGDTANAIRVFQQLVQADPSNYGQQNQFARLLISAGKLEEARTVLDPILAKHPENVDALYNMALLEDSRGNTKAERVYLEKIITKDPANANANASIGQLYLADNELEKASKAFEASLKSSPDNLTALIGEGNVLLQQNHPKKAETMFDRVIKLQPDFSFAYSDRAQAREANGDYSGAEADLTKAIKLNPGYYWHYIDRGKLRLQFENNRKGALADFTEAVKLDPNYFLGYVYLAGMADDAHNYGEAAKYYKKLLELRPDYYFVYRPYAILLYMQQKWDQARTYFEKAYRKDPTDHGLQMLVVLTYLQEKDNVDATAYLKRMLAELPSSSLFYGLAKMYLDPSYDVYYLNTLKQERNPDVRTRMLFYVACFYALHGKTTLAVQYFLDVNDHNVEGMYEYRINKWELEKYRK